MGRWSGDCFQCSSIEALNRELDGETVKSTWATFLCRRPFNLCRKLFFCRRPSLSFAVGIFFAGGPKPPAKAQAASNCDFPVAKVKDEVSGWAVLSSRSIRADGRNKDLADAVTLLARVVQPPHISELSIHLNHELCPIQIEDYADPDPDGPAYTENPIAYVEATDDRLIVLADRFRGRQYADHLLVYDAVDASLSVVPVLSRINCVPKSHILPVRRRNDSGYALAIMAEDDLYDPVTRSESRWEVLCLWPPPPSSKPLPPLNGSIAPWQVKEPRFPPEKPEIFCEHTTFSFQGQAFWADLGKGLLFCDCEDMLSGGYQVPFRYVPLPSECTSCGECGNIDLTWSRAMSCCDSDWSRRRR
ncbi:uncharacterized protein LOC112270756 [Brachypodium distachyon]|uniref:uncharacterized protein LOC112270756 n=1 Tax=Brachypodium distachyon TaxID=15368 RepID=UPI000D0E04BD|nr:uncharacterized protein LOC112270756 [Brachypodium distachyon]|eukprot:XP_024314615.1 uncharacterized protein LOC112270756 [Brachypodium distachyon]